MILNLDKCKSKSIPSPWGKNSDGGQESLAAKAFSAQCDKMPINPELEHNERCIRKEYKAKFIINKDIIIPDPLNSEKWVDWWGQRNRKLAVNFLYGHC